MGTELDMLAIGNCILRKHEQLPALRLDYKNAFTPD
jgi:carbamoyltransferase